MLRRILTPILALSLLLTTNPVLACGGFFCDAVTLSPIYQAGERILFSRDDTTVTMHIEIVYQGDPTAFGWILPLAEIPTGQDGEQLPLEELLQLSSQDLFNTLQNATDPTFARNLSFESSQECQDRRDDQDGDMMAGGVPTMDFASSEGGDREPSVTVLQEAAVGPYDAQLIEADSGDKLFEWLNEQGYFQDPKSLPLLEEYVEKGFKFLGIKLQNGQDSGDIKPIALTMSEQAPCVPLKLTSIAATPEMPILVWVLGEGRAVPKNFIHAVVNEQALTYPGAQNYVDVVTAAVDTVEGRAWVTEYAQSTTGEAGSFAGAFLDPRAEDFSSVNAAESVSGVLNAMSNIGYRWSNPDVEDVLRNVLTKPEGLTGYPNGNCYWNGGGNQICDPDESHITTDDEFYGALDYWAQQLEVAEHWNTTIDLAMLKTSLYEDVIQVRERIQALFDKDGVTLTRFFTTLDADEMTRDPIFSFNPDLPDVVLDRTAELTVWSDPECEPWGIMQYPDGSQYTFDCNEFNCFGGTIGPVPDAPALKWAQILEETGLPRVFDPAQAAQVDEVLDQTVAGGPTLPEQFVLEEIATTEEVEESWPNPPVDHPENPEYVESGCEATGSSTSWLPALLFGLLCVALRRRRDATTTA
ncbi:MAG: DUF2330 domain-containing protein [Myxococcota bacterium]